MPEVSLEFNYLSNYLKFPVTVLLNFKASITSDPLGKLNDWSPNLLCSEGWYGVCCNEDGSVTDMLVNQVPFCQGIMVTY